MDTTQSFPKFALNPGMLIFRGCISILFGIVALAWPLSGLLAIAMLYGVYAFVDGAAAIGTGIRRSREHPSSTKAWGLPIFEGILGIIAGLITFFYPGITLLVLSFLVGAWAVLSGLLEIAAAFKIRALFKESSKVGRALLGLAGLVSVVLGVAIFLIPSLGVFTLLTFVAAYALITGVLFLGLGVRLRHDQKILPDKTYSEAA